MSRFATYNLGPAVSANPVTRGLILHWLPLVQRTQGNKAYDLRGRNDGTPSNGAVLTSGRGKEGLAWQFDTDALLTSPSVTDTATTFSLTGWTRWDSTPGTTILFTTSRWRIQRTGGNLCLTVPGVADNQFTSLPISNAAQWYFFAVTLTGTAAVGYLDGLTQSLTITAPSSGNTTFIAGDTGFGLGLPGQMTDIRLYSRVLNSGEVNLIRRDGLFGQLQTLSRSRRRSRGTVAAPPAATRAGWLCLLGAGR